MSHTTSSRPKPRPRPRPVPIQSSSASSASGLGSGSTDAVSLGEIVIKDSDELFLVNRGRTRETWERLEHINKAPIHVASDTESDDSRPSGSPLKKRPKKDESPKWQREHDRRRRLPTESSDDFDSDLEITTPSKRKNEFSQDKHKQKQARSKSRSITPPPALPAAALANARSVIRRALETETARVPSPTGFDEMDNSTDTIILDPELECIAKAVNSRATQKQSIPSISDDAVERVIIHVKWQKHPLNPTEMEPTWPYRMRVDEPFRELFETVAEDAQVLVTALVLSYKNKRVFPSTRPDSLRLWGEVELTACHQMTYDYIQQKTHEFRQTQTLIRERPVPFLETFGETAINVQSDGGADDNSDFIIETTNITSANTEFLQTSHESDAESEADTGKFKLVVRSDGVSKSITLIVRPTTKCGAIIKAYIKKVGLADQYPHMFSESGVAEAGAPPTEGSGRGGGRGRGRSRGKVQARSSEGFRLPDPRLVVDGDKLDNTCEIGEADLADGDMVDIIGL